MSALDSIKLKAREYEALIKKHNFSEANNIIKDLKLSDQECIDFMNSIEDKNIKSRVSNKLVSSFDLRENILDTQCISSQVLENIPNFSGSKNEDFTNWLFFVDRSFKYINMSDEAFLTTLLGKLSSKPLDLLKEYLIGTERNGGKESWNDFRQMLVNRYRCIFKQKEIVELLECLEGQNYRSVKDFNDEFLKLVNEHGEMIESDKIKAYTSSSDTSVADELRKKCPESLIDAIALIESLEHQKNQNTEIIRLNNTFQICDEEKFEKIDKRSGKYQQNKKNSSHNLPNTEQPKKFQGKCNICGKHGHLMRDCYHNLTRSSTSEASTRQVSTKNKEIEMVAKGDNLIRAKGFINDKKATMLFCSGSQVSIISKNLADRFNLKIKPTSTKLKDIIGITIEPFGETDTLEICVGESCENLKLIVLDDNRPEVLLGWNWMQKSHVEMGFNMITFHT